MSLVYLVQGGKVFSLTHEYESSAQDSRGPNELRRIWRFWALAQWAYDVTAVVCMSINLSADMMMSLATSMCEKH